MKKLLMSVFCMALCSLNVISADDDLNPAQLQLRNEIKQFIAEEGFMPEIDSDGDIHFKKEGDNYYITVSANDEAPMYVVLSRPFNNPEGYSPEAIKIAASELNLYKGVKVLCWDTSFSIRGEMFLVSSEAFKYSFYKIMSQLENIENDFLSELEKVGPSAGSGSTSSSFGGIYVPGLITDIQIANVKQDGTIINNYGSRLYDFNTRYLKPKITLRPFKESGTYTVYVKMFKNNVLSTGSSSPAGFSYSDEITLSGSSSQTFYLSGWGSDSDGHWEEGDYRVEVWYGNYCIGSTTFEVR